MNGFLEGVKVPSAYLVLFGFVATLVAITEAVGFLPYELAWLVVLVFPDALRKLFKLNTEAVALVLRELDFWVPFVAMCLSVFFISASFEHDLTSAVFCAGFMMTFTVNVLLADADLATRKINSKASDILRYINILLGVTTFSVLLTFDHFPRAKNHGYKYQVMYNEGTMEVVSMFTRFMVTVLLFACKFVVKSFVYKGRTVIIKIPLVRHVMPKRRLNAFLRRRAQGFSVHRRRTGAALETTVVNRRGSGGSGSASRKASAWLGALKLPIPGGAVGSYGSGSKQVAGRSQVPADLDT